jgi:hypothetical protein
VARTFSIVFLALALAITAAYRKSFFATPFHEEGDSASNALQIHRARSLREIHGNYSQWGFYHPGPAFFYVYAVGEAVLHDALHLTPAPRNAHTYAGTLLQLAFYAVAIALFARHTRQPALTVALALAAGALHYAHADRVLYSTWPPDVLLMPMLCLVVAGAALAAAVLFGVFLLPIAIDACAGRASNFHNIALHLRYQRDAGQSLWQSLLCYGSYFLGLNDPSAFNRLAPGIYAPFARGAWLLALWAIAGGAAVWRFFRPGEAANGARFGRALLGCWLLASALTLVWGMKQDGGLTSYNSHFNHSLVHVLALGIVLAIAGMMRPVPRVVCAGAVVGAVAAFALAIRFEPEIDTRGRDIAERLPAILAADPLPRAPKLILFDGDDWFEAVTLARALQRVNMDFVVHPANQIMFGADKVLRNEREVSVWQISPTSAATGRRHVLNRNCSVVFPAATNLDPWPARLDLARTRVFGIAPAESAWTWTDANVAIVELGTPRVAGPLTLTLDASGLTTRLNPAGQRVRVLVNGQLVATETFPDPRRTARIAISAELWNARTPRRIAMELPDALAPAQLGDSADRRLLGLRLFELRVALAEAAR